MTDSFSSYAQMSEEAEKYCGIDGCGRKHKAKGLCTKHYDRLLRHGDPLKVQGTSYGSVKAFYDEVVLSYEGDECLIWPFSRRRGGYAQMNRGGKPKATHRLLCEDIHGSPPTATHEAAHSCGNGHLGCVAKKHLSWKTPTQNIADKLIHGTHNRGEKHNMCKLTEAKVKEILSLKGVETSRVIAERYGVSSGMICRIHSGKNWSWVKP